MDFSACTEQVERKIGGSALGLHPLPQMLAGVFEVFDGHEHVEQHRLLVGAASKVLGDRVADRLLMIHEQADGAVDAIDAQFGRGCAIPQERGTLPGEYVFQVDDGRGIRCKHADIVFCVSHDGLGSRGTIIYAREHPRTPRSGGRR